MHYGLSCYVSHLAIGGTDETGNINLKQISGISKILERVNDAFLHVTLVLFTVSFSSEAQSSHSRLSVLSKNPQARGLISVTVKTFHSSLVPKRSWSNLKETSVTIKIPCSEQQELRKRHVQVGD
jgi:hypothetical protein